MMHFWPNILVTPPHDSNLNENQTHVGQLSLALVTELCSSFNQFS